MPHIYDPMPRKDLEMPPTPREAELMAEVKRLWIELSHCVYELEREGSRPEHRRRRAYLARKVLEDAT